MTQIDDPFAEHNTAGGTVGQTGTLRDLCGGCPVMGILTATIWGRIGNRTALHAQQIRAVDEWAQSINARLDSSM
ncbi:hypothetical protein AWV79_17650 [Cupriavidus sp. UYMMa02A]|nr:hypothetical protein AWV79_17650 [Cupriavidus sp. UYMMa02A]